jgi:hypothetical protein
MIALVTVPDEGLIRDGAELTGSGDCCGGIDELFAANRERRGPAAPKGLIAVKRWSVL